MKKLLSSLLLFTMMISSIHSVQAAGLSNWHEFRANNNVITTASPDTASSTKVAWSKDFTEGWDSLSDPIIVNDEIFVATATNSKLLKLDLEGNTLAETSLASYLGYNINIAYGDGMIFVALGDGRVQAFDAISLTSLWISDVVNGSIQSKFTYHDGYLYFGSFISNYVDYTSAGSFYAVDVRDENTTTPDELKSFAWTYQSSDTVGGYNWAKAVVYQEVLYFIGADGILVAHDLKSSTIYQETNTNYSVASPLTLLDGKLYFTSKDGNVCTGYIQPNHSVIIEAKPLLADKPSSSTSTPTIANGRLYVGGGQGYGEPGFITVQDATTRQTLYTIETLFDVQASPLVTTAYDGRTIAYFTMNGEPGGVYALTDDLNSNTGTLEAIYTPVGDAANYCMSSVISDSYGHLYHFNDSGYLTKLIKTQQNNITLKDGDVQVYGNLPTDAQLSVKQTNSGENVQNILNQNQTLEKITLYEFNLTYQGMPLELSDTVQVSLTIPTDYQTELLKLYYLNASNTLEEFEYTIEANQLIFNTNHFSTYVLAQDKAVEAEQVPTQSPTLNNKEVPPTGDKTNNTLYFIIGGIAIVGIIVIVVSGRKKK